MTESNHEVTCEYCNINRVYRCLCAYKHILQPIINKKIGADRKQYQHESTVFGNNSNEYINQLHIISHIF